MFSHMFLLFESLLSYSSIFANSLLISFFTPFLAAGESDVSSRFLIPLALRGSTLLLHPHVSGTECMEFLKEDSCRNLVVDSLPVSPSPFRLFRRFLMQTSIGRLHIIPFLLTKILKLSLSCVT
jgi:hypothetical protein